MALLGLWMSLVGVSSIVLGLGSPIGVMDVPGWGLFHRVRSQCPGSRRGKVGFRFSLFLPCGVLVIGLNSPIGVMDVPGWG